MALASVLLWGTVRYHFSSYPHYVILVGDLDVFYFIIRTDSYLVGGLEPESYFPIFLGMSSSQLTHIFQRGFSSTTNQIFFIVKPRAFSPCSTQDVASSTLPRSTRMKRQWAEHFRLAPAKATGNIVASGLYINTYGYGSLGYQMTHRNDHV